MDIGTIDIHDNRVSHKNLFKVWLKLILTVTVVFLIYVGLQMWMPDVHPIFTSILAFLIGFVIFRILFHQEIFIFLA